MRLFFIDLGSPLLDVNLGGGISYRPFLGNCLRDYLANCYRGFLAIGLLAQILRGMMIFFRWALNFLSRYASYMKKKKS